MKNIHVLKSDKPSRLHLGGSGLVLCVSPFNNGTISSHHIYITSDEEIKEGDWILDIELNRIEKCQYSGVFRNWKKIILTTDQDLIADGVQAIDDEFLEWFVKNPSCEEVIVEIDYNKFFKKGNITISNCYEIIIPKEEPNKTHYLDELPNMDKKVLAKMWESAIPKLESKQETLEEAAENYVKNETDSTIKLIRN
jgi:hypothetical protein